MTARSIVLAVLALMSLAAPAAARDLDYERLSDSLERLAVDPRLGTLAPMQMDRARAALQALKDARRSDRPYLLYIAERRVDIARVSAEAELAESERMALQRENDRLQLEAARRDAEQARRELERQRLLAQIRAEEAERLAREAEAARAQGEQASQAAEAARAEAAQAKRLAEAQARAAALAKKEAELAGSIAAGEQAKAPAAKRSMTLGESAFARGKSALTAAGKARIAGIVDFVNAAPGARVRIEASAGGDSQLATARAEAVRDALVAAGVAADRIAAATARKGKGSQVEIRLEGAN
jgi:outer membrane protein OmpA-like peptidoglycan-associated protein